MSSTVNVLFGAAIGFTAKYLYDIHRDIKTAELICNDYKVVLDVGVKELREKHADDKAAYEEAVSALVYGQQLKEIMNTHYSTWVKAKVEEWLEKYFAVNKIL